MDNYNPTTDFPKRKKGSHLKLEERMAIRVLKSLNYSIRVIALMLGCSPSTVSNELKRGTPPKSSTKGRNPSYLEKRGEAVYRTNRAACHRPKKVKQCPLFINWVTRQVREHKWSLDACCGYAKLHHLFEPSEMVCSRTLYNWVWSNELPLKVTELPDALRRNTSSPKSRENKRKYGKNISERPIIANMRTEEGHWEGDTVIGKKGKEAAILSLLEKKTENYLAIRIRNKTSEAVMEAMQDLRAEFGDKFSKVFKTITVDNGSEFSDLAKLEDWGTGIYFTHPYSSWERAQNERHNGLFRAFFPKGVSLENYSEEDVLMAADELNGRPRKKLGYRTPEELFDKFLDSVYAT